MSRFGAAMNRAEKSLFLHKGDEAIYTSVATGVPVETLAIVYTEVNPVPGGFDSTVTSLETHIALPANDVKKAKRGDKITVGGKKYTVDDYATFGNTKGKVRLVVK